MAAVARYEDLPVEGLPLEFWQNKEPKLLEKDLLPASYPKNPDLEWCPPGHGDLYTALRGTGLLEQLIEQGYERVFVSNSDNLGAVPDPKVAGLVQGQPPAVRDRGSAPHSVRPQGRPLRAAQERRPDRAARDRADAAAGPGGARRPRPSPVLLDQQPVVRPGGDEQRARPRAAASSACR